MQSHATVAFLNKKSFFNGMSSSIPISMQREDVVNIMQKGCKNYLVSSYLLFFRCFRKMKLRKNTFQEKICNYNVFPEMCIDKYIVKQ